MLLTRDAEFLVHGVERHHVWLEALASEDKGMRVSVPLRSPEYSDDLQEAVLSLSENETITCQLESDRDPPDWRIKSLSA